jgi:AraC-like DNA-binding protein
MMVTTVIFTAHFFYFAPVPDAFPYLDWALVYSGLLVYPMYHIYFRLLTIDEKFSFKVHTKYLVVPTVIFVLYLFVVLMTPWDDYKNWLFKGVSSNSSPKIQMLQALRQIIIIIFIFQLILSLIGNHQLILKYGDKAEQFYSDMRDGKNKYSKMLNYSILVMSVASLAAILLGRFFLVSKDALICVVWSIFSASLFVMGDLGLKQKIINPTIDPVYGTEVLFQPFELSAIEQSKLLDKILEEFTVNKIHLNQNLIIMDLVKILGTNRSYISSAINQQYNQNFCSFTNGFRIEELKSILQKDPEYSLVELAEICGFGSVNSMKRAISSKTGLIFADFKKQISADRKKTTTII